LHYIINPGYYKHKWYITNNSKSPEGVFSS
jgi:hypothetical protein